MARLLAHLSFTSLSRVFRAFWTSFCLFFSLSLITDGAFRWSETAASRA